MKITGYKPTAWIFVLVLALWLPGCGGGSSGASLLTNDTPTTIQPSADVESLQAYLQAEFSRLGIDPHKVVAAAPQGSDNVVFDLDAEIVDPDGAGGDPPTSITLSWTEQLCGDYDQNGLVNASDLTPLGVYWEDTIAYDDPSLHGGFKYWPTGDPDAGGADNWRLARVDGNRDGQVYQYDITPIAVHWKEQLSGYRVYRKGPLDLGFRRLPDPADTQSVLSISRPEYTATQPVRYAFTDDDEGSTEIPDGIYAYYIAPFDASSGQEGPASAVLVVSTTGVEPQAPVAQLNVTPEFAGAPAVITLDASSSYDEDGTIAAYHWDFDADGVVDWVSTEPVPERSSSETVTAITPAGDGMVTVSYNQGSADWYFPSVIAEDDLGLMSLPAYAKLGISGWVSEVLNPSIEDALIRYHPSQLAISPQNGNIFLACTRSIPEMFGGESSQGLWLLEETSAGTWDEDEIPVPFEYDDYSLIVVRELLWDENLEPIMLFTDRRGGRTQAYAAQRETSGTWEITLVWDTSQPDHPGSGASYVSEVEQWEPGRFAVQIGEWPSDKQDLYSGMYSHYRSYVGFYEQGEWSVEYTGYDSAETYDQISCLQGLGRDELLCYFRVIGDMLGGVWRAEWEDGAGFVNPQRLDDGSLHFPTPYTYCREAFTAANDSAISIWEADSAAPNETWWWIRLVGEECNYINLSELNNKPTFYVNDTTNLYTNPGGIGMFVLLTEKFPDDNLIWEHWRPEGSSWITERVQSPLWDSPYDPYIKDSEVDQLEEPVVLSFFELGIEESTGFDLVYLISKRVDPRNGSS